MPENKEFEDKMLFEAYKAALQSERDKHRWIPVTERLPTEGLLVLALFPEHGDFKQHYEVCRQYNGNWYDIIMEHTHSECDPILWQPLPEA